MTTKRGELSCDLWIYHYLPIFTPCIWDVGSNPVLILHNFTCYVTLWTRKAGLLACQIPDQEIIEGIGYPGQKNSHGGLCTLGCIYYGPGRYDYGRPKMPKGWVANIFYPLWEFGFLKAFWNVESTLDRS